MDEITKRDLDAVSRMVEDVTRELESLDPSKVDPRHALATLIGKNLPATTKFGGEVEVSLTGRTAISKVRVALGEDLCLSVTTPRSGKWRVLCVRGFPVEMGKTIRAGSALAIIQKIFTISAE